MLFMFGDMLVMVYHDSAMDKAKTLELLRYHRPEGHHEKDSLKKTITFVEANDDYYLRSNLQGHLTASAWVVDFEKREVLLTHHRKLDKWVQLGGHIDETDESLLDAAMREVGEESMLKNLSPRYLDIFDIDVHEIPEHKGVPAHIHHDVRFLVEASKDEAFTVSEESKDLAWIPLDDIMDKGLEESSMRMAYKTLEILKEKV
jgi:8-oxo-dGTP pyrophosphatase MutT (NUDIX family)